MQTTINQALLACALERYRLGHGKFPDTLAALVPRIVAQLPQDMINGQPLKYQPIDDGQFVLYSVGWYEQDDGGTIGFTHGTRGVDPLRGDWVW